MKAGLAAIMVAGRRGGPGGPARRRDRHGRLRRGGGEHRHGAGRGALPGGRGHRRRSRPRCGSSIAHKGFVGFEIEAAGAPRTGRGPTSASTRSRRMGHVLVGIEELDRRLRAEPTHPLLRERLAARVRDRGRPGVLQLSGALPAQGRAAHHSGRGRRARRRRAAGAPRRRRRRDPRRRRPRPVRDARGRADRRARLPPRRRAGDRRRPLLGRIGSPLGRGHPHGRLRPAGEGAHAVEEWVDLASAERCAEIYAAVARDLCA